MRQAEDDATEAKAVLRRSYLLQILAILITVLTLVPPYIGLFSSSPLKRKMLHSSVAFATNISEQFGKVPSGTLKMKLTFNDIDIKNFYSLNVALSNTGDLPILPGDYASNISMNVNPPWKIIGIFDAPNTQLQPEWKKISDQKYEALPQLFRA